MAAAFGLGVWIAFFPVFGIHTLMALGIAFALRLSRAAILIGAYINNPWTVIPMYLSGTFLGCLLLGIPADGLAQVDWQQDMTSSQFLAFLRPYFWPYVVGNTVLGVGLGFAGYLGLRHLLERRRGRAAPPAQ